MAYSSPHKKGALYPTDMRFTFDDSALQKKLQEIINVGVDLSDPFGEIAGAFRRSKRALLQLEGPGVYIDLAPSTKRQKKRKYGRAYPPLVATGDLIKSIISKNNPMAYTVIKPSYLTIGSRIDYLKYHELEYARGKRGSVPQRKILFFGPEAPRFAKSPFDGLPGIVRDTIWAYFYRRLGFTPKEIGNLLEARK